MPRIGPYTMKALETGTFRLDGGAMFGIIPKALWGPTTRSDDRNRITLAMRCLLLEGDGRVILIDNGLGDKYDDKFAAIFAVDHQSATLEASLAAAGFSADDVTDMVLTHLHFDHCGGSTRRANDGGFFEVTFPNATYHVQKSHWEWANEKNPRERASFLDENLVPLRRSGQLRMAEGPGDILPGLEAIVVNGHTEGQQAIKISDGDKTLVYVADLIPTSAHLQPVWGMAYDINPLATIAEKESFLTEAAAKRWSIFFEHDPNVEVLDVEQKDGRFRGTGARALADL